jgi:hypothetical protein
LGGNLVRINDAAENAYVDTIGAGGNYWIGGNDIATEGTWVWTAGPAPTHFWQGTAGGSAQNGLYTNWNANEPNDAGGEDAAIQNNNGGWNDLPSTGNNQTGMAELPGLQPTIFNGHRYVLTAPTTRADAQAQAEALRGDLIRIDDAAENAFALSLIASLGLGDGWIGASDAAVEDEWRWDNNGVQFWQGKGVGAGGAPVNGLYSNWNPPNEPNGDTEDFAELIASNGLWNDIQDNQTQVGIIEIAIPEPNAFALGALALLGLALPMRRRRNR